MARDPPTLGRVAHFVRTRRGEYWGKRLSGGRLGGLFFGHFKPERCQVVRAIAGGFARRAEMGLVDAEEVLEVVDGEGAERGRKGWVWSRPRLRAPVRVPAWR
jgi:hypothetical protein